MRKLFFTIQLINEKRQLKNLVPKYKSLKPISHHQLQMMINSKVNFNGYTAPPKAEKEKAQPMDLSDMGKYIPPDVYDNFIIYRPQNSADVEKLIDYLRSRKPAIVDLDPICDSPDAQRVLDFTSGAVYALGGKIAAIKPNLFLIVSDKGKISQSD